MKEVSSDVGLRGQDVQDFDWQRLKGRKEGWRRKSTSSSWETFPSLPCSWLVTSD